MRRLTAVLGAFAATTLIAMAVSASAPADFGTRNGDTANIDVRCLVPLPEGEGIGGHALGILKAACNSAPVDQLQAPQKLL